MMNKRNNNNTWNKKNNYNVKVSIFDSARTSITSGGGGGDPEHPVENFHHHHLVEAADADDDTAASIVKSSDSLVHNPEKVDTILANELHQLSMKDRDQVFQELHGVADRIEEIPEIIIEQLEDLEKEIQKNIRDNNKQQQQQHHPQQQKKKQQQQNWEAYQLACNENPYYFNRIQSKFRLAFLRAEKFNIEKAAIRIRRYFHEKLFLFGKSKLGKEQITLQDLSVDDIEVLNSGYLQWLTERDRSGRAIFFAPVTLFQGKEILNVLRAIWYSLHTAWYEDEETQKHGIITLNYLINDGDGNNDTTTTGGGATSHYPPAVVEGTSQSQKLGPMNRQLGYHAANIFRAIPIRMEGMHVCCNQIAQAWAIKLVLMVSGPNLRIRTRCHFGSPTEICYTLLSFGIPVNRIPITSSGEIDLGPHMSWMESRRRIERLSSEMKNLSQPTIQDGNGVEKEEEEIAFQNIINNNVPMELVSSSNNMSDGVQQDDKTNTMLLTGDDGGGEASLSRALFPSSFPSSSSSQEIIIMLPRPQDVLFGNLKVTQTQQGNAILRSMIEEYQSVYEQAVTKSEKMQISRTIMAQIKTAGGRFLKQTKRKYGPDGRIIQSNFSDSTIGWIEVKDQVARDKIGHAFRKLRTRQQKDNNNNSNNTSLQAQAQATLHSSATSSSITTTNRSSSSFGGQLSLIGRDGGDYSGSGDTGCFAANCGGGGGDGHRGATHPSFGSM